MSESRPKDGASWPDKHTPHVHTSCQKMGASWQSPGRKMEHLGQTNTHHIYTHSVKRWVHLDRVRAERWSILVGQTHTTCRHILSKDGCILTEFGPKDGASWPHTPHVMYKHKLYQCMIYITMTTGIDLHIFLMSIFR